MWRQPPPAAPPTAVGFPAPRLEETEEQRLEQIFTSRHATQMASGQVGEAC